MKSSGTKRPVVYRRVEDAVGAYRQLS